MLLFLTILSEEGGGHESFLIKFLFPKVLQLILKNFNNQKALVSHSPTDYIVILYWQHNKRW